MGGGKGSGSQGDVMNGEYRSLTRQLQWNGMIMEWEAGQQGYTEGVVMG